MILYFFCKRATTDLREISKVKRISELIRMSLSRIDKQQRFRDKVTAVQEILGQDQEEGKKPA